jgi:hypothetical protein
MDIDWGVMVQRELSNISFRLMHAENTHAELLRELTLELRRLTGQVRDLKAELLTLGDLLLTLSPQRGELTAP